MRARKKLTNQAQRRLEARNADKAATARERLAKLEAGGEARRPIDVPAASVIEVQARGMRCLRCLGECKVAEHAAAIVDEKRLRVVDLQCPTCGTTRRIYFRIVPMSAN